jgi:hypothetical protein
MTKQKEKPTPAEAWEIVKSVMINQINEKGPDTDDILEILGVPDAETKRDDEYWEPILDKIENKSDDTITGDIGRMLEETEDFGSFLFVYWHFAKHEGRREQQIQMFRKKMEALLSIMGK